LSIAGTRRSYIGCCGLRRESHTSDQAELGIELAPQFWGRYAYAIEVANAVIEFGFRDLGLKEIRGISVSANLRVARLAHRYGFVAIGTRPTPDGCVSEDGARPNGSLHRNRGRVYQPSNNRLAADRR
jgi:RimJ/RimL family protein N-acetyltransferase